MTKAEKKKLYNKIEREILGYSSLGFFDWDTDSGQWKPIIESQFSRKGVVNGEEYSSTVNNHLGGVGLITAIDVIRKRLQKLLLEE